jgi:hypothetical protein
MYQHPNTPTGDAVSHGRKMPVIFINALRDCCTLQRILPVLDCLYWITCSLLTRQRSTTLETDTGTHTSISPYITLQN